nr:single-stranded DNA-binding protein [Bacteroidota bacterium]
MAGVNKVILIGNLGKDPDIMTFENGVKRAACSIATTESYKDKEGNWVDQTEWHNIVLWRWLAERNLLKGDTIYLEGKLRTRSWDDKDGNKRYTTEIIGDKVIKLTARREQSAGPQEIPPPAEPGVQTESSPEEGSSDDLPF